MSNIKLFEDKKIRVVYDEEKGDYWFCLVDVVETLTNSKDPNQYLKRIRSRDEMLNFYIGTNCTHVEMINKNGKRRKVLAGTTKDILRLIQSIPSPKAEPFKLWLASLGSERLDEISNPELAINRGLEYYKSKGYEESWINQRITSIGIRKELTDEWKNRLILIKRSDDMKNFEYKRLDQSEITEEQFKQVLKVEQCEGEDDSYPVEVMKELLINDKKNSNFVCIDNDEIVGYIAYNPLSKRRNGSIYIISLVVLPEYRKMGIGKNLIYTACKYYEKQGFGEIMSLQVDKENIPAINLYKKLGFEILDPICEADEDDEQYIMATKISTIIKNFDKTLNKK